MIEPETIHIITIIMQLCCFDSLSGDAIKIDPIKNDFNPKTTVQQFGC